MYAAQLIPQIDVEIAKLGTRPERVGLSASLCRRKRALSGWKLINF